MRRPLLAATALVAWLVPRAAFAADSAAAEALFVDAKKLLAEGHLVEACAKFEESLHMEEGIGTLYNLADCHERIGKTASAWGEFTSAAAMARAQGQAAREQAAHQRAAALEPRLSKIVVRVGAPRPGLVVKRDETVVGPGQYGTPIPIDPGEHTISASAPRKKPWSAKIQVAGTTPSTIDVPGLEDAPEAAALAGQPSTEGRTQRIAGVTVASVGVVGLIVGAVFGAISMSHKSEAEPYCNGNDCTDQQGVDAKHSAVVAGNISTVSFVVGGLLVAGGAVLWFTAPKARSTQNAKAGVGFFGASFGAGGTW